MSGGEAGAVSLGQALQEAIAQHQSGQLAAAERWYRLILAQVPHHPDANHNLGVLAVQVGQPGAALPHFEIALQEQPAQVQYWVSYIDALVRLGRPEDARRVLVRGQQQALSGPAWAQWCRRLAAAAPATEDTEELLGHYRAGRLAQAIDLARRMTVLHPGYGWGWKVLGALLRDGESAQEAIGALRQAAILLPDDAEVHNNLAVAYYDLGSLAEAEQSSRQAILLNPSLAQAHNALGNALKDRHRAAEAEASYRQALALAPEYASALVNLGGLFRMAGRLDEADDHCTRALAGDSANGEAWLVLGDVCLDRDDGTRAREAYGQCVAAGGNAGLITAVNLAVLNYVADDLAACRHWLAQSAGLVEQSGRRYKPARVYRAYLESLLAWWGQRPASAVRPGRLLHVVGDSHTLAAHATPVSLDGEPWLCQARWIPGCKQWHLGQAGENAYKRRFAAVMASLPAHSTVLLTIGEIDCRHDEGILEVCRKHPDRRRSEVVKATVTAYVDYLGRAWGASGHRLIVAGVPCTNVPLALLAEGAADLGGTIREFNRELRRQVEAGGMGFLDLHGLTDAGGGLANGAWHIDHFHLTPEAYGAAFAHHLQRPGDWSSAVG